MKIVIMYTKVLPFIFRNLTSEYSSYAGKISINIDWLQTYWGTNVTCAAFGYFNLSFRHNNTNVLF
jgi:hypothetical protein